MCPRLRRSGRVICATSRKPGDARKLVCASFFCLDEGVLDLLQLPTALQKERADANSDRHGRDRVIERRGKNEI